MFIVKFDLKQESEYGICTARFNSKHVKLKDRQTHVRSLNKQLRKESPEISGLK